MIRSSRMRPVRRLTRNRGQIHIDSRSTVVFGRRSQTGRGNRSRAGTGSSG